MTNQLVRPRNRVIAGVCSGLARRFGHVPEHRPRALRAQLPAARSAVPDLHRPLGPRPQRAVLTRIPMDAGRPAPWSPKQPRRRTVRTSLGSGGETRFSRRPPTPPLDADRRAATAISTSPSPSTAPCTDPDLGRPEELREVRRQAEAGEDPGRAAQPAASPQAVRDPATDHDQHEQPERERGHLERRIAERVRNVEDARVPVVRGVPAELVEPVGLGAVVGQEQRRRPATSGSPPCGPAGRPTARACSWTPPGA